jgi:hypothetical protein
MNLDVIQTTTNTDNNNTISDPTEDRVKTLETELNALRTKIRSGGRKSFKSSRKHDTGKNDKDDGKEFKCYNCCKE